MAVSPEPPAVWLPRLDQVQRLRLRRRRLERRRVAGLLVFLAALAIWLSLRLVLHMDGLAEPSILAGAATGAGFGWTIGNALQLRDLRLVEQQLHRLWGWLN